MENTGTRRIGTGSFSIPRNVSAGWTTPKTSRRPASSVGRSPVPASRPSGFSERVQMIRERCRQPARSLHWQATRGRQNAAGAKHFRHCSTAPPTRTWFAAVRGEPSLPAIRGSLTGVATRSSLCVACASPQAGSPTRATSWSNGLEPCQKACCQTGSPIMARRPSSTPSTRPSGTSSRSTSCCSSSRTTRFS